MNFSFLLLPFKWFALGLIAIAKFIYKALKHIVIFVLMIFKTIYKILFKIGKILVLIFKKIGIGIYKALKGLVFVFKKIGIAIYTGFKYLFKYVYLALKTFVVLLYKGILALGKGLVFIFKKLGIGIYIGFKFIFKYLYIIIKKISIAVFYAIKKLLKQIINFVKYFFIGLKVIFVSLFKGLKLIFKYLFIAIKFIIKYIYKFFKFIFINLFHGFLVILKLLAKIPIFIWSILKKIGKVLYKIFIYPFVYLFTHFKSIIIKIFTAIGNGIKKFFKFLFSIPSLIKTNFKTWYDNLSFVKDGRNRREMKRQKLLIDFESEDAARSSQKILYKYLAKNSNGKMEKGRLSAFSKLDVHSYLLAEGYEVYEIEIFKGLNITWNGNYKIKANELVFFLTQLSTYIKAGIPLVDSIKILARQAKEPGKKSLYKAIVYELTMGDNFSESLEKQGESFPRLLVNMIKSAELAGNLPETLDDMANYYTSVTKTRKAMVSAMMYPLVIFSFATLVVTFILIFVIPEFVGIYEGMDAELPAITSIILGISDFLAKNILYLLLGLIVLVASLIFLFKNVKVFKTTVQWILMHVPVVGNIIIYNEVSMFAKTFGSLLNHSVFITDSMEILSKITNNEVYKMLIFDTITNIAKGEPISKSFKDHWAFPMVAYEMLVTGERTGQPGPMMNKVADYYQEEHKNAVNRIKVFIEPVMIIFLACIVGVILLSVILPMFNLYGNMGA